MVSDPNIKRLCRPYVTVRDVAVVPAFQELPTEPEAGCSAVTAATLAATLMHSPPGTPREEISSHLKEGAGSGSTLLAGGPARV